MPTVAELSEILNSHKLWLADQGGARANLRDANLRDANLTRASLTDADLTDADLTRASLTGADLTRANLTGADLTDADLTDAKIPFFQIPQEGSLIVWKRLNGGLAKLRIPETAKRTASLVGRKCRAEFAEVLWLSSREPFDVSKHDDKTEYRVGETVYPDNYDDDVRIECTNGIHFLLTREEAEKY